MAGDLTDTGFREAMLQSSISAARQIASSVGPQHSLWDLIFDAEALLAGKPTLVDWGERDEAMARLSHMLASATVEK